MSQHDYNIANQTGLEFRADLNNALSAIVTQNSGSSAPTTTFPGMEWLDTISDPPTMKRRNQSNTAWEAVLTPQGATITGAASSSDQRTALGIGAAIQSQQYTAFNSTGTAPAYVLTPSPSISAYTAGQRFRVKAHSAGTTGSNTLNVSSLGAKSIKQYDSTGAKVSGVIASGQLFDVEYDGTDFVILSALPSSSSVPPGAIMYFAMQTAPAGWITCDGALISRSTYPALFAAIGTIYGAGDGSTTFKLPDLRGEFIRGHDANRGIDSGRVFGSSQAGAIESHNHTLSISGSGAAGAAALMRVSGTDGGTPTTPYIAANGGTETRPRNIALNPCIKY